MPTSINVAFANYSATGSNVSMPQVSMDISASWINDAGLPQSASQTVLFPNILAQVPVARRDELLQDILYKLLRLKVGIET